MTPSFPRVGPVRLGYLLAALAVVLFLSALAGFLLTLASPAAKAAGVFLVAGLLVCGVLCVLARRRRRAQG